MMLHHSLSTLMRWRFGYCMHESTQLKKLDSAVNYGGTILRIYYIYSMVQLFFPMKQCLACMNPDDSLFERCSIPRSCKNL